MDDIFHTFTLLLSIKDFPMRKKLEIILSQFDCAGIENYVAGDYISFSALGRANGSTSFYLIFDYTNSSHATKSRDLIVKDPHIATAIFNTLLWGRKAEENEKNELLDNLLSDDEEKGKSGW